MKKFRTSLLAFLSKYDDWELVQNVPCVSVFDYYYSSKHNLYIHLVECNKKLENINADYFQQISLHCYHQKIKLIHLREEQWLEKQAFVEHRLYTIFEANKKIHARQCVTQRIEKKEYDLFLNQNHLLQTANTRFKFGIYKSGELLAVMGISAGRWMTKEGELRKSFEIIRFATKTNYTVVGGFSKLLKYIEEELEVQEWMTYYDLDWVQTNVYHRLGFELKQITKPTIKEIQAKPYKTYSSGNLKLIKRVR